MYDAANQKGFIHENHLYACFAFLGVATGLDRRLWPVFCLLSVTFAADLVLTLYMLNTSISISLGPIRLSSLNAGINVGIIVWWTRIVIRDLVFVGFPAGRTADIKIARAKGA